MPYTATKQHVLNRGRPSDSFLDELVAWGKIASDEIFAENSFSDIYSSVRNTLGPWNGLGHRRAVMLEVMRVLAGFESSWTWNEGPDQSVTEHVSDAQKEAGAWQVSGDSMAQGPELRDLVLAQLGSDDSDVFQAGMKNNHPLAMEYIARLLRRTTRANGPVRDHLIDPWLRRDAVKEFESFLGMASPALGSEVDPISPPLAIETPDGRGQIERMFGRPNKPNGDIDHAWESGNIRMVTPPAGWQLYYQGDDEVTPVSGISLHRLLAESFRNVLSDIWVKAKSLMGGNPTDSEVRQWLHARRLDQHSGGFHYRPIRGTSKLSLHSYGIAIDWDANNNPQGSRRHTLPDWWYEIWHSHGWSDGRHFPNPDAMHVQFATGA